MATRPFYHFWQTITGTMRGSAYIAAHEANRTLVGSEDVTVGLEGQISNGGHGILSHGLSSDQVLHHYHQRETPSRRE